MSMMILPLLMAAACYAVDGDTIRCGRERVRLVGIDAPELAGHCRRGRVCVPGDAKASKLSLAKGMQSGLIRMMRIGRDRYGRTLAQVNSGHVALECWQLKRKQAIYKPEWDKSGLVASLCKVFR